MADPQNSPPHTFQEVIDEWKKSKPAPTLFFHHIAGQNENYDSNFTITYEVTLDGWRYVVQGHVHNYHSTGKQVTGKSFVPGFKGQDVKTPDFVLGHAPAYNAKTHNHGWSSDKSYQDTLYQGSYRYPTKTT